MSLRGVPDDELDDICALFEEHKVPFHITPPGNWNISAGAIWVDVDDQYERACTLLNGYQLQRYQQARKKLSDSEQSGEQSNLLSKLYENPLRFLSYLIIIAAVLYFSVIPFTDIGK